MVLALLTLIALILLFAAVREGLLGRPEMQVSGPAAMHPALLEWYADRSGPELPHGWVISLPLWVYRVLMLGWALWLAFAVLGWLRWGWQALQQGGLWRSLPPRRTRATSTAIQPREGNDSTAPPPNIEG